MAYKFQRGSAILSGSLEQEGAIKVENEAGSVVGKLLQSGVVSGSGQLQGASLQGYGDATAGGRVIVDSVTDATSTTDGSLQTDGGLSVVKDAVIGNDLKLLSDSAVLSLGAGSDATFTHDGTTGLTIAATPISIDSTGELHLNSTTGDIKFQDGGTDQLALDLDGTSGEVIMQLKVDSDDFVFKQYDGTEVFRVEDDGAFDIAGGAGSSGVTVSAAGQITAAGRVIIDDATEATTTTDGSLQTDGGLSVAKSAVIGDDLDLLSDSAVLNFGADKDVSLTHVDSTGLLLNSSRQLQFGDSGTYIHQSADGVLDLVSDTEIEINATTVDINGAIDASSTITAAGRVIVDDATEATSTTDGSLQTDGGLSVAKSAVIGDDLDLLSNSAIFKVGSDQPFTLTHANANNTLLASTNHRLAFGDAGEYIFGDGTDLKIVSSHNVDITGDVGVVGALSCDTSFTLDAVSVNATELGFIDGASAGTVVASKAVVVDSNKDVSGIRKLTLSGSSSDELIVGSGTNRTIGVVIDGGDDFFRMGHGLSLIHI